MKKIFRSKVELLIGLPVLVSLIAIEIYLLQESAWTGAAFTTCFIIFLAYLYRNTSYEFTGDRKLKVRSGFLFEKEIYINSIKKITHARSVAASPALSSQRLQIFYNRYDLVVISPQEESRFISQLQEINPRITVD